MRTGASSCTPVFKIALGVAAGIGIVVGVFVLIGLFIGFLSFYGPHSFYFGPVVPHQ